MAGIRVSKAEMATRVDTILSLVLSGLRRGEMCRFVTEKKPEWGISTRTLERYIARATVQIEAIAAENADRRMAVAQTKLLDLYKRSMNIQDYKTCLSILKEESKLNDLYPAERQEISGPEGGPIEYSDAKQRLRDRLAKRRAGREDGAGPGGDDE